MMRPFLSNPSLEFFSTIAYPTVHFPHQNITKSHSAGARTTNTPIAPAVSLAKTDTSINKSRTTRPKIVKGKAIQCHALNSKRGSQCRNAALMEYIGPRPHYCAEHIDQDPESLYTKCKSEYYKARDDRKGCKEIVLKEFVMCHKHFEDHICCFDKQKTLQTLERVTQLLSTLTSEAEGARKVKVDLFQRKNKIIPKFQRMKSLLESRMALSFSSDESHADVNENVNDNPSLSHPFSLQSVPTSSSGSCSASPSQPPTPPCNETADTDDDHDVGGSPQLFQPSFEGGNEEEDGEEEDGEAEEGRDIKEC